MEMSEWALLGFAVWTLLVLQFGIGVPRISAVLAKRARPGSFNPSLVHGSERYQRTMRAHLNCVENLPIFVALVLLGAHLGMAGWQFQYAAAAVLPARMLQTVAHISSGRDRVVLARFTAFTVQLVCFFVMAALIALHAL